MSGPDQLTPLQVRVAKVFFNLPTAEGYVVTGGAALLANDLIDRPTHDIDLFASHPVTTVSEACTALTQALEHQGLNVKPIIDSPTFARLAVASETDEVLVDLAIDSSPQHPPRMSILGPTLSPRELAGRKLLALFDRAEARDFADVYRLNQLFSQQTLVAEAARIDPGFDPTVLAQMIQTLDRFHNNEIPLPPERVDAAREHFRSWAQALGNNPK